jgi:hypothetical protein
MHQRSNAAISTHEFLRKNIALAVINPRTFPQVLEVQVQILLGKICPRYP